MKYKYLTLSLIFPLLTVLITQNSNQFGWPIHFLFYYSGNKTPYISGLEVIRWENLINCSFRLDLYLLNAAIVYFVLLCLKVVFTDNKNKK